MRSVGSVFLVVLISACVAKAADVEFNRDVLPLLADYCFECHGPDEESRKAGLRLDRAEDAWLEAIIPGKPEESPFVDRLFSSDPDDVMPPPKAARQPSAKERQILEQWIAQGAEYDAHWAFEAPQRKPLPEAPHVDWVRNGVDHHVSSFLGERNLEPQEDAEATVLARRLSLALTGLPLQPERLREFAADFAQDEEGAVEGLVDELLASEAYGEHHAWSWMDASRYADTNGYQADAVRTMWPWRDWLIENLNANVPFDQLTRKMLAGDLMLPDALQSWETADWIPDEAATDLLVATGFLRNHRYDTGSGTIPAESKFENATDRLETFSTVWMGLTMQCARCHTHKFDPIEQREYYQLLSFFDNVPEIGSAMKEASHPYIHTPQEAEREKLLALREAHLKAEADFEAALPEMLEAQAAWEASGPEELRVTRGMKFRYAQKALRFDGTNPREKTNDPIALCKGSEEWSISFWFRPETMEDGAIFSSVEEPERYRPGIQADWVDGKIRVRHVCRWVNSYIEFESRETLEPGQWYHVSFRSDGRMQGLAYEASLNGEDLAMICTHEVTNDSANNHGKAPLVLGGSPLMPGFAGGLRDLHFYDRTISAVEVSSLAEARSTAELAAIPSAQRTPEEVAILQASFLESEAISERWAKLRDNVYESEMALKEAIQETPTTMVMQEADRGETRLHAMGAYDQPKEAVGSGTPDILPAFEVPNPDRLDLAEWLVHPDHPLTARVAVNRIWQNLWGRGFVTSPENFGIQCAEPEHVALLDWLATEYVRLEWDTKALIKLIVTSRTYRQSSAAADDLWQDDPENRWFARGPRFRLPIHAVRDQALVLSGRLEAEIGGPPVLMDEVRGKDGKKIRLNLEENDSRRTIYNFWKRNAPHPMLAVFDVADRNQCDVRVHRTNTPLQALVTLNEPGLAASAAAFSERARAENSTDEDALRWSWLATTGREATAEELELLTETLTEYRNLPEADEDVAWKILANVLLNLDATLTLE